MRRKDEWKNIIGYHQELIDRRKSEKRYDENIEGFFYTDINDKYPYGKPQTDEVARGSGNREYGCRRLREKLPNFSGVSFF